MVIDNPAHLHQGCLLFILGQHLWGGRVSLPEHLRRRLAGRLLLLPALKLRDGGREPGPLTPARQSCAGQVSSELTLWLAAAAGSSVKEVSARGGEKVDLCDPRAGAPACRPPDLACDDYGKCHLQGQRSGCVS